MNSQLIFNFEIDPKLRYAYGAHEAVLELFKKTYRRSAVCSLYIGTGSGVSSTVTARWEEYNKDAAADAQRLLELADDALISISA